MKTDDLSKIPGYSVPCPTCGVTVGNHCLLASGFLRLTPHTARKVEAAAVAERKWRSRM
jgi:hypothetical protein